MIEIFYQIKCSGPHKYLGSQGKYFSKKIYDKHPSQNEINDFIDLCCSNPEGEDLADLKKDEIKIDIHQLNYEK